MEEKQETPSNIINSFMSLNGNIRKIAIMRILKRKKLKKLNGKRNTIKITDKDINKKVSDLIDKEYIEKLFGTSNMNNPK